MEPRRKDSLKWTPFPHEFVDQIKMVFREAFGEALRGADLFVDGRIYGQEIVLRVGFRASGQLRQSNFEVSLDYSPTEQNALEQIYCLIDAIAGLMAEMFEGRPSSTFPTAWKELVLEGRKIHFQFSTVNTDLEAQADALLGEAEAQGLFNDGEPEGPLLH